MAEKMLKYYKHVGNINGLAGKMKLAQITKIPSTKAAMAPDSPQNIAAFKKAVQEVTGKPTPSF